MSSRHSTKFRFILFFVYSLHLEYHRACAVGAAAYHFVLMFHPAFHDAATLQACVDVAADGIPCFRAMGHLRATSHCVRVSSCLYQGIDTTMPEMIVHLVTLKDEFVAHVIAGTHTRLGVSTILCLKFWI